MKVNFKDIYIQSSLKESVILQKFLSKIDLPKFNIIYFDEDLNIFVNNLNAKLAFKKNLNPKKTIIFANQNGKFIKKCPCTPNYLGCNYYVVELAVGCLYDCSYCYLQEYQNISATIFYLNFDKLFNEFDELLKSDEKKLFRIGFGEYADSLFLDEYLNYTATISNYLSGKYNNYLIEYKTKSNNIANILNIIPSHKEVIGWSVNSLKITDNEEKFTSNFYERLEAMKECSKKDFFIALHFDPIVYYDGYLEDYSFVISEIYKNIDKKNIIWISLGTFRFNPKLRPIIELKNKDSLVLKGEFIKGLDKKERYYKKTRIEIYKKIVSLIKAKDSNAFIYFCMEDSEVYRDVLNLSIKENEDIHALFCSRLASYGYTKDLFI